MAKGLFRQEAIDAQREKFLGEATIARPVPMWAFTLLAVATAGLVIAVAILGQYTRRERVEGFLELDVGAARVSTPDAGIVAELLVKEGSEVKAGQAIAKINLERATRLGGTAGEAVTQDLRSRRVGLETEQRQLKDIGDQQIQAIRKRVADLQNEVSQADREIKLQGDRVQSAKEEAARYKKLEQDKFVSDIVSRQKQNEVTDQELRLQQLRRQRSQIERDLSAARLEEPSIMLRTRNEIEKISRQLNEVQQNITQVEVRRETIITAPVNGTVTNVAVNAGQSVAVDALVGTIVPTGSGLHARLLVPTRAIGFVTPGKEVSLRYEAFPFERFGQYRGVVSEVGRTVWSGGERVGPLTTKEPMYRVDVKLDTQRIAALNQEIPLKPGMLVNADILLEQRSILEWLLEPVLRLKGRFE